MIFLWKDSMKLPLSFSIKRNMCYKVIKRPNKNASTKVRQTENYLTLQRKNTLMKQIQNRILLKGPISVADYMKEVLTNPLDGYYMKQDVFGPKGDFITSPEILQVFGELVTIWSINEWKKIGAPKPLQIVEIGPGRGTLAGDIIRVLSHLKLNTEISLHLIEVSPFLSKLQVQKLCFRHEEIDLSQENISYYMKGETVSGIDIYWYKTLEDIPKNFSIFLANEFFDALPIHKFQKESGFWKEILIDIDPNTNNNLRYVLSKWETPNSKIFNQLDNDNRECLEYSFEAAKIIEMISTRLEQYGGIALIVDYGHLGEKSDTFRAFKNHKLHDPLIEPGSADLTADVDFSYIKYNAEKHGKAITFGPIEQGIFLRKMESDHRLKMLLEHSSPENKNKIKSAYAMLVNEDKMGKRFKVLAIFPAVLKNFLEQHKVCGF